MRSRSLGRLSNVSEARAYRIDNCTSCISGKRERGPGDSNVRAAQIEDFVSDYLANTVLF